ncbi:MAG: hypothetical protein JWN21_800 [Sphingomonas bacterium]|uniref:hypothetical protein n=1 Tax=Sphingomonas bacterium TaxID=1895847 RepID=UPI002603C343|nr:hypothetical protein [Sphingomonas bacterium]MDB5695257.1 hypothetical protein [Sphingomonas bacterium]
MSSLSKSVAGLALIAALSSASSCASTELARDGFDQQSPRDLIVLGRIKTLSYEATNDPDDILGHGWITAELHVRKVISGKPPSRSLIVRYFAHSTFRDDRTFRLRLRRIESGQYLICSEGGIGARCE